MYRTQPHFFLDIIVAKQSIDSYIDIFNILQHSQLSIISDSFVAWRLLIA